MDLKNLSSSQIEADIVFKEFNISLEMHRLKYTKFTADGDSRVYAKL